MSHLVVDILMIAMVYNDAMRTLFFPGGDINMTEQEAIRMLIDNYPSKEDQSVRSAYDLAIDSLRTISAIYDINKSMDDY
ncbi:MAG: hypothetical protein AVO34_12905 [Firmicutes bacterium ML8_F2]|nr:MAG: hypothetical protein AVO34_12905 [Firmicutes bacterium ML8_F2]